jgi:cytochrome oxidase Cu insertion factor (SCO1/SenC/PrrC family)
VISRSGLEPGAAGGGGYLQPGDWTTTIGVRHVYSHVHFSGPTQNFSRAQLGTEVQSKTNLDNLLLTYQMTPRFSVTGTFPFVYASRRQQAQYATLHTSGIGDISIGAQGWLRSPRSRKAFANNAQFGVSLLIPSGNDHQNNVVATTYGGPTSTQYPDYSVQPGAGTWGAIFSWQGFQNLGGNTIGYIDGSYTMTQGGYHNFWTSHGGTSNGPPSPTAGMTQFDAIQDQYMLEVGGSHPAPKLKGLGLTLALRAEGVPAHNWLGNDLGFRRPGFGVALTPGFIYTSGPHMLQFSVGKVLIRDRTRSVAEEVNGARAGDAAFANYVWMASYTIRIPKKRAAEALTPAAPASGAPARAPAAGDSFKAFALKSVDGQKKTLRDYLNKVTAVTFFYPRCPYCNIELPEIQKIYDRHKEDGLSAVWINILPEETGLVPGWLMAKKLTVPVLVGGSQDGFQRDYGIESTPTTYLLDANGRVLYRADGYKPGDETVLEQKIAGFLGMPAGAATAAALPICPPAFAAPLQ